MVRAVPSRAVPAALLVALLVGCGVGEPELESLRPVPRDVPSSTPTADAPAEASADVLLERATSELQDAPRFAMVGSAVGATDRIEFDYLFGAGGDVEGETLDQGVALQVRVVSGTYYLNGDEAFWAASLGTAAAPEVVRATQARLAGRWVAMSPADASSLRDLTRERLLGEYLPTSPVERVEGRDVDGRATVGLRGADGVLLVDAESGRPVVVDLDDGSSARFDLEPPALEGAPPGAVALRDLG